MKKFISNTTILVGCALATTLLLVSMTDSGSRGTLDKMRGVCWVAGDSICAQNLEDLTANHIGWISQTPFAYQPKHNEPHMRFGESNWVWGEREAGIVHTTKLATAVGVQSLLKPHIWLHTSHGK